MADSLQGRRVAILATDGVEQVELERPLEALRDAGAEVHVISLAEGEFQGFEHLDRGRTFVADRAVAGASAAEYDALVLPGGVANPDFLRADRDAVRFVREFVDADQPVAAICHGPWTLVEAGAVAGRTLTSWPSLRTDIRNAGGRWVDEEACLDGNLLTSRRPDDLDAFCAEAIRLIADTAPRLQATGRRSEPGG